MYSDAHPKKETASFKLGIGQMDRNGNVYPLPLTEQNINLSAGKKIKFFIQPFKNTHIYIFALDGKNNPELIFPEKADMLKPGFQSRSDDFFYLPRKENEWFSFDDEGRDSKIRIIVSKAPLVNLEKIVRQYLLTGLIEDEHPVVTDIKKLMNKNNPFLADRDNPNQDTVLPFAGVVEKGIKEELRDFAKIISFENLCIFTISCTR